MIELPQISVILPVYNGERYLHDALESIRRQGDPSLEVIVVDDGSTDGTARIVREFPMEIAYLRQSNQGPQHARNRGLESARGELITFLDADDRWADGKLARQRRLIRDADVVIGMSRLMHDDARPFLFLNLGAGMFRRSALERVGPFDGDLFCADDLDLFFRAREAGLETRVHAEVVLYHRRHENNLSNQRTRDRAYILLMLHKSLARRRAGGASDALPQFSSFLRDE